MVEPPPVPRPGPAAEGQRRPASHPVDRAANREVAGRLHEAVQAAGGNLAVARRSGVPLATVNNYVRGRNGMKIEALSAVAAACNVSLQWLVSGDGTPAIRLPALPDYPVAVGASPAGLGEADATSSLAGMSGSIDVRILAKAIEIVVAIAGAAELRDDPKGLARRIATTYAVLIEPDAARK